ncbi:hypothetical protein BV22DRAFT_1042377 [Leucogyrophana mollusca]|uniref:Uncharacterized protein n=1 Tax=Leucogyrophana mollusca TaxID=85980 RepID=A0ACB8AVG6_9AGAM|nr:hypothetical protein BV22DRAFT_1042377 [Leucogyrophana mollusca]
MCAPCDQETNRNEQSGDGSGRWGVGHLGDNKQYPFQLSPYPHHRQVPVILSVNYSQPLRPYNAEGQYTTPVVLLAFLIGLQCCMSALRLMYGATLPC